MCFSLNFKDCTLNKYSYFTDRLTNFAPLIACFDPFEICALVSC